VKDARRRDIPRLSLALLRQAASRDPMSAADLERLVWTEVTNVGTSFAVSRVVAFNGRVPKVGIASFRPSAPN
jgi:hypothetical protein